MAVSGGLLLRVVGKDDVSAVHTGAKASEEAVGGMAASLWAERKRPRFFLTCAVWAAPRLLSQFHCGGEARAVYGAAEQRSQAIEASPTKLKSSKLYRKNRLGCLRESPRSLGDTPDRLSQPSSPKQVCFCGVSRIEGRNISTSSR